MDNTKLRGGKRICAGRKKTCLNRIPFNRRINENILNILKEYAERHAMTETEALESAILMQSNVDKQKGEINMKIAIPTLEGKLCSHFGHCETFSFIEINPQTKKILNITTKSPEAGISCQSASWVSSQGVNLVLAGGMGQRPMNLFKQNGVEVLLGCPELDVKEIVEKYLDNSLVLSENSCSCSTNHDCHCGNHSPV